MKQYQSAERKGIERGLGKNTEWVDQDLAVKADTPLIDSATGKKLIVRMFDFQWNKGIKRQDIEQASMNKQQIFNSHVAYIKSFLWKDGLTVREDHDPKLIFTKEGYRIAVLCEARFGLNIFEKGNTLQDLLKVKKK